MNFTFFAPALALVAPLALGMLVLRALGLSFRSDRLAYFGWVWLVGSLATAGLEFLWLLVGLGTHAPLGLDLATAGVAAALFVLGRRRQPVPAELRDETPRAHALFLVLFALALAITLNKVLLGTLEPIYLDDEAHFWAARAKALFTAGGLGPLYQDELRTMAHADYPLLNPLLQLWIYVHAGEVTHVVNRLPIQLALPALVLVLASAARRWLRAPWAGFLVLAFVGSPMILSCAQRAHSDVLVALGGLVLFDAYLRWRSEPRAAWVVLAAAGATYLVWAKSEGLLVLTVLVFVAALFRLRAARAGQRFQPRLAQLAWLAPFAAALVTVLHNRLFEVQNGVLAARDAQGNLLERLVLQWRVNVGEVLGFFGELCLEGGQFQLLPVALLVLVLLNARDVRRYAAPLLVLTLTFLGFVVVLIATPSDVDWHVRTAGKRLAFQLYPSMTLYVALLMSRWLPPASATEPGPSPSPS